MSITMYGADWCGDCRRAKAYFADNNVEYTYIDLIENPDETKVVLERNGGKQRIPVIIFSDDSHLTEPTNDQLAAKLAELAAADSTDTSKDDDAAPVDGPVVTENVEAGQFELRDGTELLSLATYSERDNNVTVPHVETIPAHRGKGNAGKLMDGMLALLRDSERTITPLCPFAAGHIRDNAQYQDLVSR